MNRTEILDKFFADNPLFADENSTYRRVADWQFDTQFRDKVDSNELNFEAALNATKNAVFKIMPPPVTQESVLDEMAASRGHDRPEHPGQNNRPIASNVAAVIEEMAVSRHK